RRVPGNRPAWWWGLFHIPRGVLHILRGHLPPKFMNKNFAEIAFVLPDCFHGAPAWKQKVILMQIDELIQRVAGAPEGIRTPDPQIRSLVLYPTELPAPWKIRVTLPNRFSQPLPSTTIFSLGFNLADVETISHNLNCVCATCPQNRRLLVMARAGENNTGSR